MKQLVMFYAVLLFTSLNLYATTPYNLEGVKALNVLVIDQSTTISAALKEKIRADLKAKLEKNGIASTKDGVGDVCQDHIDQDRKNYHCLY